MSKDQVLTYFHISLAGLFTKREIDQWAAIWWEDKGKFLDETNNPTL